MTERETEWTTPRKRILRWSEGEEKDLIAGVQKVIWF
jgi:hypothetical protein